MQKYVCLSMREAKRRYKSLVHYYTLSFLSRLLPGSKGASIDGRAQPELCTKQRERKLSSFFASKAMNAALQPVAVLLH